MQQQIDDDLKAALIKGDKAAVATLRLIKSALIYARVENRAELDDAQVIKVLQKQAKQRQEAIESFRAGDRPKQAAAESAELEIISAYLPANLSQVELEQLVTQAIAATAATTSADMGKVMKALSPKIAGRADGKQVVQMVQKKLQ